MKHSQEFTTQVQNSTRAQRKNITSQILHKQNINRWHEIGFNENVPVFLENFKWI